MRARGILFRRAPPLLTLTPAPLRARPSTLREPRHKLRKHYHRERHTLPAARREDGVQNVDRIILAVEVELWRAAGHQRLDVVLTKATTPTAAVSNVSERASFRDCRSRFGRETRIPYLSKQEKDLLEGEVRAFLLSEGRVAGIIWQRQ